MKLLVFLTIIGGAFAWNYEIPTGLQYVWEFQPKGISSLSLKPGGDYSKLSDLTIQSQELQTKDFELMAQLPALTHLDLSKNQIKCALDLGVLSKLKNLTHLYMYSNNLEEIINTSPEKLPSMNTISIFSNNFTSIDLKLFASMVNLENLYVHDNLFVRFDGFVSAKNILPRIQSIPIQKNNFVCSDLKTMVDPIKDTRFWYSWTETSCTGLKNVHYEGKMCCYPTVEAQKEDNPLKCCDGIRKEINEKIEENENEAEALKAVLKTLESLNVCYDACKV